MSDAATSSEPFRVAIGDDGRIVVPADEVARHGLHPGELIELFPRPRKTWAEISAENAAWQREHEIPAITDEEAERIAVEASRDIHGRLNESA